jgi:hypothetical protein
LPSCEILVRIETFAGNKYRVGIKTRSVLVMKKPEVKKTQTFVPFEITPVFASVHPLLTICYLFRKTGLT